MSANPSRASTRPSSEVERLSYDNGSAAPRDSAHRRQRSNTSSSLRSNGTVRAPSVNMDHDTSPLAKIGIKLEDIGITVTPKTPALPAEAAPAKSE